MLSWRGSLPHPLFRDRREAGLALAGALRPLAGEAPLVLGLPRGGVPVALEVAQALRADLDVLVVRKVGAPGNEEVGVGAVAEGGVEVCDEGALRAMGIAREAFEAGAARARAELAQRVGRFRAGRPAPRLEGRHVILVDDGIATGATARAAVRAARALGARHVTLAAPVGEEESVRALEAEADRVVVLATPSPFLAVGKWYRAFAPTPDEEVELLLGRARRARAAPGPRPVHVSSVHIDTCGVQVRGELSVPEGAVGLVLFAHGAGSGRMSPRNQHVAHALNSAGLATLLPDLLTAREGADETLTGEREFGIGFLSERLMGVAQWAADEPALRGLPLGYFGCSTGAAAALTAAAYDTPHVDAVVSRGGRTDLAAVDLKDVETPTLLVVGECDSEVLTLNQAALVRLGGPRKLLVVRGAGHLFEEAGALDQVARAAAEWFVGHFAGGRAGLSAPSAGPHGEVAS